MLVGVVESTLLAVVFFFLFLCLLNYLYLDP